MLTFKRTKITFFIITTLAVLECWWLDVSWFYLLQIPLLYLFIIGYGSAYIQSGFFLNSVCRIDTNEKIICLTFDDGPDENQTPVVLDILKQHNVKAVFFVIGKKIHGSELLLKKILEDGHVVANHSFSHSYFFDFYSTKKVTEDLNQANKVIKEVTGLTPRLFRPPYGVTNPNIAKALQTTTMTSIGWNVRSLDTVIKNTKKLYQRVTKRIKPGSILLFHDTGAQTTEILKEVILFAQKNGYTFARLDQALNMKAYEEQ